MQKQVSRPSEGAMTAWILDREHPMRGVVRVIALLCALAPLAAIIVLGLTR